MDITDHKQRLAAILAADAAGYSRLMSLDAHATVAALDAARTVFGRLIETHQGRVIDMAGDSVLAVFDTAIGAVSAALAVQAELEQAAEAPPDARPLMFRIGIHLGDLIEKEDGSVYGDGVNIAARLEALAEPGGIVVSDSICNAVKGKVAAEFEAQGAQKVKNIAEPVRTFRVRTIGPATDDRSPADAKSTASTEATGETELALPDKPSIAVLPFVNLSGDAEQEIFSDGVSEDLITELSRFRSLFVIARNSSFSYKGRSVDARTVARELGVRYVLEGSIRKAGNRIRITGQLVDTVSGQQVWAEKFDRVLEDVFALQEEITRAIAGAISSTVAHAEVAEALRKPGSLSAYETTLRAKGLALDAFRKNDPALTEQCLREVKAALAIDPDNPQALCTLAYAHWQRYFFKTAPDPEAQWQAGVDAASQAINLDPAYEEGYRRKAQMFMFSPHGDQLDEALANARRAFEVNPNSALVLTFLAMCELRAGDLAGAITHFSQSIRMSPRDPSRPNSQLAIAHFMDKNYAAALEFATQAAVESPSSPLPLVIVAIAQVGLNDIDKAKVAGNTLIRIAPKLVEDSSTLTRGYRDPEHRLRMTTFLQIAAGQEDPAVAGAMR